MAELNNKELNEVNGGMFEGQMPSDLLIRDKDLLEGNDGIYIPSDPMNN